MSLIYLQTSFSSGYIHRDKVSYPHSDLVGRKGENLLGCCYFIKIFISYAAVFALFIHSANFVTYPPPVPLPTSEGGSTAPTRRSFTKVLLPKIGRSKIIDATELRLSMFAALSLLLPYCHVFYALFVWFGRFVFVYFLFIGILLQPSRLYSCSFDKFVFVSFSLNGKDRRTERFMPFSDCFFCPEKCRWPSHDGRRPYNNYLISSYDFLFDYEFPPVLDVDALGWWSGMPRRYAILEKRMTKPVWYLY